MRSFVIDVYVERVAERKEARLAYDVYQTQCPSGGVMRVALLRAEESLEDSRVLCGQLSGQRAHELRRLWDRVADQECHRGGSHLGVFPKTTPQGARRRESCSIRPSEAKYRVISLVRDPESPESCLTRASELLLRL